MNGYWKIIGHLCLFLSCCTVAAQENAALRLEFSTFKDATNYHSVSAQKEGLFVFHADPLPDSNSNIWKFNQYDTNLHLIKVKELTLPSLASYRLGEFYQHKLFLWFQDRFQRRATPQSYLLIIDNQKDTIITRNMPNASELSILFMKVIDDQIILVSYNKNQYTIYNYNIENQKLEFHPCNDLSFSSIDFCETDTVTQWVYWGGVLKDPHSSNEMMHLVITDKGGNIIQQIPYPRHPSCLFNTTRIAIYDSAKAIITGTYTNVNNQSRSRLYTGTYTIKYKNTHLDEPEFFPYTQLSSVKNKSKNKNKNINNLEMIVGPLFFLKNQLCLIAETYYPEYSTSYYHEPSFGYGSRATPITTFEGYHYENAFITTFDTNGQLLWSYYIPFNQVLQKIITSKVHIAAFGESHIVYYLHQGRLTYTVLEENLVIEPLNSFRLSTTNTKEEVDYSIDSHIQKWYGNYFLASGYQYIKGNANNKKSNRYVYYINKMEFR